LHSESSSHVPNSNNTGSDAEKKGVKPGDELLALNGYAPNRENFLKMQYIFNALRPQTALMLDLRDPAGKQRQVEVTTALAARKTFYNTTSSGAGNATWEITLQAQNAEHLGRARFAEVSDDVAVLKLPRFFFTESEIKGMIDKARKHKALVLDLRGNAGGSVDTLKYLIAGFFEKEVKIGDRVGRSERKPLIAEASGHPFTGKLVVLVDSKSASASELFARVVQIEKRATVLGDRSSGSVMEAKRYGYRCGVGSVLFYGASITEADMVMTDGASLEHNGVLPDEVTLPSAEDLANGRDPVLARAIETVGAKLNPEEAGKLFPYEWPTF
jgi:C-terminal processing protease CtpA/Prc